MRVCFICIIFLTFHCFPFTPNKETKEDKIGMLVGLCLAGLGSTLYSGYEVEDKKDGTLVVYKVSGTANTCFGDLLNKVPQFYIKKCIQGQVYRKDYNDCKGKGTQENWWGAEKFQWCPTNDNNCDDYKSIKSPAKATCLNDTTVGKKWHIATVSSSDKDFKQRKDEIPSGDNDVYWTAFRVYGSTNKSQTSTFTGKPSSDEKVNFNYVLCEEDI